MRKLLLATTALIVLSGAAKADQVTYTSSGTFNTINCVGCSGSGTATYNMSGLNNSTLTAVAGAGNFPVPANTNDSVLGSIRWTNNASILTDTSFDVRYTFNINFTAPTGAAASTPFFLDVTQTYNPLGDFISGFNRPVSFAALEGLNLGGNTLLTDVHWELAGAGNGVFDGNGWYNSEGHTATLNLVGDFISVGQQVGAVPEASTWAMMLLGFAGIVVMGAKRRREGDAAFRIV
jgi:hypothetical protein